jgi:hypothetical protein
MGGGSAALGGTFLSALNNVALPAALRDIATLVTADRSATFARSELYQNTRRIGRANPQPTQQGRSLSSDDEIANAATTAISRVGI